MISDNKDHITYSAEDIQRYWKGQLSPREMHALEKAALDDPFLADALEGMGEALRAQDEQTIKADLQSLQTQLEARVGGNDRKTRVVPFRWWKLAAAAVVIAVSAIWIFTYTSDNKAREMARQETMVKKNDAPAPSANTAPMADKAERDSLPATNAGLARRRSLPADREVYAFNRAKQSRVSDSLDDDLQGRSAGIAVNNEAEKEKQAMENKSAAPAQARALASEKHDTVKPEMEVIQLHRDFYTKAPEKKEDDAELHSIVKGIVTDNKNNPLANAYILLDDKKSFVTDPSGYFKIPVKDSVVKVSVSLPGYATQNFRLRSNADQSGAPANDANNQIRLQPSNEQLSEVVVTGYGKRKYSNSKLAESRRAIEQKVTSNDAEPVYGWLSFNRYLEKNKRIPQENPNLIGEVVISFTVNKKGELSDFKVDKPLSPQHDAEAIRLVREGPAWKLNRGRKAHVTVIVRF
jgi:hypothetical protein